MNTLKTFPIRLFIFAFVGWTFDFYDLVLLGFLRNAVGSEFHLSHSAEAWLLGIALGTSGVGGIVAGFLADRLGKRTMLASTVLVYSLGSLLCGVAPSLPVFIVGRAIVGLGVGGEWAIGHGMLAEAIAPELRGRAAALLQAGEPIGVMLAAIVGYVIMPLVGWRWVMIGSSATAFIALLARRSLSLPNIVSSHRPLLKEIRRAQIGGHLFCAWVLGVFKMGTYWTCYTWLPGFLVHEMGLSIARSLTWMLTAQMGQLFGMISFGFIGDSLGRRPAFCVFSLLTAAAIAPLVFAWSSLTIHPVLFWSTMFALGLGSGCTAGFGALLAELFPTEIRGTAMGFTYNMARSAQLFAPVLVNWAVMAHGFSGGLAVPLCLSVATASWVWVLPETRGIVLPSLGRR